MTLLDMLLVLFFILFQSICPFKLYNILIRSRQTISVVKLRGEVVNNISQEMNFQYSHFYPIEQVYLNVYLHPKKQHG